MGSPDTVFCTPSSTFPTVDPTVDATEEAMGWSASVRGARGLEPGVGDAKLETSPPTAAPMGVRPPVSALPTLARGLAGVVVVGVRAASRSCRTTRCQPQSSVVG
jgi:hypothetical protein